MKKRFTRFATILVLILAIFTVNSGLASASTVHITNFSGKTTESTSNHVKDYVHFYSSRDTINVKFKVDEFVKTKNVKRVHIDVQKSNGLWWTTQESKSVTSTSQISFNVSGGKGDYRLVIYDAPEMTGWDKPPFYYAKSSRYSGVVTGL